MILVVVGARPNLVKAAPLISALRRAGLQAELIHTGQHYDENMSDVFFEELDIPAPLENLAVGHSSREVQCPEIMLMLTKVYHRLQPEVVVTVGDVTSTMAATLTAMQMGITTAHVEAGLRVDDLSMPEEQHRRIVDAVSDLLFAPNKEALKRLQQEGRAKDSHNVGNVMVDCLQLHLTKIAAATAQVKAGRKDAFGLVTLHRAANVDDPMQFATICCRLAAASKYLPMVWPVHPRTRDRLSKSKLLKDDLERSRIQLIEPQSYLGFLGLMGASACVVTDSGGVQVEATAMAKPCWTLRHTTEWPETLFHGSNRLCTPKELKDAAKDGRLTELPRSFNLKDIEGFDGQAAKRIAQIILEAL